MMNFDLENMTAAELRALMNDANTIRANKVANGFKHIADAMRDGRVENWVSHGRVAQSSGMSARQSSNWQNAKIAYECGLDPMPRYVTKHYVCEEDGSRLTIHKCYEGYTLR